MFRRAGRVLCCLLGSIAVMAVLAQPSRAGTVNISPELACTIGESGGGGADCESGLLVGNEGTDAIFRHSSVLQFDLGGIPAGAKIVSAQLHAYTESADTGSAPFVTVNAYEIDTEWDDSVDWNDFDGSYGGYQSGNKVLPGGGDALEWDLPSLYFAPTVPASFGVALDPATSAIFSVVLAGAGDATPAQRPYLEVEYTVGCESDPYAAAQTTSEGSVYYWNTVLLDVIRAHTPSTPPTPPTRISRAAAMLNTAIFDTMNSAFFAELEDNATGSPSSGAVCGWEPFVVLADAEPDIDTDLAVGVAARDVLLNTYPGFATLINTAFSTRNGSDSDADAEDLGEFVADEVIASRTGDGSAASMSYTADVFTPGAWRQTPTLTTEAACDTDAQTTTPGWGNVTPFTLSSGSKFRQTFPGGYTTYASFLASSLYATQYNTVKDLGNRVDSASSRTADQKQAAFFWANDLVGTYKPPGQLLEHTKIVVMKQPAAITSGDPEDFVGEWSRQGIRVARLYALVSLGMADGAIAAWDQKFLTPIDLWRPASAIQNGLQDGNASTTADVNWQPLSQDRSGISFNPCFPAWVSGHATFAGAWSRVMEDEFAVTDHTDPFPLVLTTEDPHAKLPLPAVGFVTRSFDSFSEAAEENADSRIWLGVHYPIDASGGLATGRSVGDNVTDNALRYTQTCAGWSCGDPITP